MTHIAFTRRGHVAGVLARGGRAVVATRTTTGHGGVIKCRRFPRQG